MFNYVEQLEHKVPICIVEQKKMIMGYTIKAKNTLDMNKFKAELSKKIMDEATAPDLVYAKKMKGMGQSMETTCLVCFITEEQFKSL